MIIEKFPNSWSLNISLRVTSLVIFLSIFVNFDHFLILWHRVFSITVEKPTVFFGTLRLFCGKSFIRSKVFCDHKAPFSLQRKPQKISDVCSWRKNGFRILWASIRVFPGTVCLINFFTIVSLCVLKNKTGTSKVGAISKAQKAQSFQKLRKN